MRDHYCVENQLCIHGSASRWDGSMEIMTQRASQVRPTRRNHVRTPTPLLGRSHHGSDEKKTGFAANWVMVIALVT